MKFDDDAFDIELKEKITIPWKGGLSDLFEEVYGKAIENIIFDKIVFGAPTRPIGKKPNKDGAFDL